MKFGVVIFPGSNCDHDMIYLLKDILHQEVVELWHKDTDLQNCDMIILPGGFSYGDYLRSGAIASLSPIMESVKTLQKTAVTFWECAMVFKSYANPACWKELCLQMITRNLFARTSILQLKQLPPLSHKKPQKAKPSMFR